MIDYVKTIFDVSFSNSYATKDSFEIQSPKLPHSNGHSLYNIFGGALWLVAAPDNATIKSKSNDFIEYLILLVKDTLSFQGLISCSRSSNNMIR